MCAVEKMIKLTELDKINYFNIVLMLISCVVAIIMPFELFLFAYAILGPLHYLTEISWLHDRQYYSKGKYDVWFFLVLGILISLPVIGPLLNIKSTANGNDINHYIYLAVVAGVLFALTKNVYLRIIGLLLAFLSFRIADNFFLFFSVFLPTLIHVFVFTAVFVLYGALKTKSKSGYISFAVMVVSPFILFLALPEQGDALFSDYSLKAYNSFEAMNFYSLKHFFNVEIAKDNLMENIYFSKSGILLMRFIAFAYTYHYLNWFSKTNVIKWHKVPKGRLVVIAILWITSISLYIYDYKVGFTCLFLLSFLHVLLELPLNVVSIRGIFQESTLLMKKAN